MNFIMTDLTANESLIKDLFPLIYEKEARQAILDEGVYKSFEAGENIMDIGQYIKSMPLVTKGLIKVMREDKDGNELLIYYLRPGDTCAMSLTCCSGEARSKIRAVAEEDTECFMVPAKMLDQWTAKYESFKNFILMTYQKRFDELLNTIDGIAFQRMDERLLNVLKDKSKNQNSTTIAITHQQLAEELNSSREVISRLLKQMELKKLVKLGRQKIELPG